MDLDKGTIVECKETFNPLECVILKMKRESLKGIKQVTLGRKNKRENMALNDEAANSNCYSPDVGNRSFKVLSSRNVESSNVASKDNNVDVDISSKRTVKTKMSRLSLKKMLNNAPDAAQSNLNKFLDLQSASKACSNLTRIKTADKSKKIKKSNKNLGDVDDLEEKTIYKVSNSIFGTAKSKSKLVNKPKKSIGKKACVEVSIESLVEAPKNKVNLGRGSKKRSRETGINKFNDEIDEKLREGLEIELEHCEGVIAAKNINTEQALVSTKAKTSKIAIDLISESNLELALIARKCKSLELVKTKSLLMTKNVRFSHEIKSFSPQKENKNAFDFLMDKVIGPRNSPKKVDETIDFVQGKNIWADHKGKRKLEDEENIDFSSKKRPKRLKKLLKCETDDEFMMGENDERNNYGDGEKSVEEKVKITTCIEEINSTKKGVNSPRLVEEKYIVSSKKTIKNCKSKANKLSADFSSENFIFPLNVSEENHESVDFDDRSSRIVPIIMIEDSSDSIASKKSFPIFQNVISPSKVVNRKPLQQTLLFCISNIDNSSKKEQDKGVQKKRKLSLKGNEGANDNENVEKSSKDDGFLTALFEKYLGQEDFIKSSEKPKTARRNRIIDSDESSVVSTTSKSSLNSVMSNTKEDEDLAIKNRCVKPSKIAKHSTETLKNQAKLDCVENTENFNLRRSGRARKTIEHYYIVDVEVPPAKGVPKKIKSEIISNSDAKVAAVFLNAYPKPKVDPAVLEARRNFLYGGSPPIKRKDETILIENDEFDPFPIFSHTQQKTNSNFWSLPSKNQNTICSTKPSNSPDLNYQLHLGSFTNCNNSASNKISLRKVTQIQHKKNILLNIKSKNPNFPVYKTYKLLKAKNRHAQVSSPSVDLNKTVPKKLVDDSCLIIDSDSETTFEEEDLAYNVDCETLWTDKYKPTGSEDIIGNRSAAVDLLKFLKDRLLSCNESTKRKKRKKTKTPQKDSSDDDFMSSDDDDSKDIRFAGNAMLIRGPHGSGKTSSIYAVCQELDINVLELNASNKRTGKILIQKLQEATQSQQIHKQKDNCVHQNSHDKPLSKMCVLLVEDIDVVFEQDEGFVAALTQMLQTTKRPIILTFTDETNAIVQKFIQQYPVITFLQLSAKTCSVWLQLICLLENLSTEEESLGELLEWNKGDLRRTLLQLQFWGLTGGDSSVKDDDFVANQMGIFRKLSVDDTVDILDDSNTSEVNESVLHVEEYRHRNAFLLSDGFVRFCNLGKVWWNFSGALKEETILLSDETTNAQKISPRTVLKSVQTFYDSLSISDLIQNKFGCLSYSLDLEPIFTTFQTKLKDSLSLEHFEDCFTSEKDHFRDITDFLIDKSFSQLMRKGYKFNMSVPEAADRRWRFKQHSCQETFLDELPLNISLDRKSFALDYFPMLISIVKIEQARLKTNAKRRNRFNSYFRSLRLKFTDSQIKCLHSAFAHVD